MTLSEQFERDMDILNAELAPSEVKNAVDCLQGSVSDVLRLRCDRHTGPELLKYEGSLLSALAALQMVCSEIRVTQDAKPPRPTLHIVKES